MPSHRKSIAPNLAGTMNCIRVGVVRGVCDYGDQYKNRTWQPYAVAMAAAYAHALLDEVLPKSTNLRPTCLQGLEITTRQVAVEQTVVLNSKHSTT